MSEERSRLNDAQYSRALKWVAEKCPDARCQMCGRNTWTLHPNVVELRPFMWGDLYLGTGTYPNVLMTCNNCGQVILFNALLAKIITPEEAQDSVKAVMAKLREVADG